MRTIWLRIDNRKEGLKLAHYLIMKQENFKYETSENYHEFEVRLEINLTNIPVKFELI